MNEDPNGTLQTFDPKRRRLIAERCAVGGDVLAANCVTNSAANIDAAKQWEV